LSQLEYRTVAVESKKLTGQPFQELATLECIRNNVTQREKLLNILDSSALCC
jgi:hypothetical protein